ncbi:hypothetical protein HYT32_02690, partial [Candidatus Roizmanbacteria bacterium]|nr:hypothetical protein [Candidatus Roizmanbacteria bacterium]
MVLSQPIETLPRTSAITIKKLKSLGVDTYFNLLNYFPFRYEDYSIISSIDKLQEGELVTIIGKVESAKNDYIRRGLTLQKVKLSDNTGEIEIVWYNQPYLVKLFQKAPYLAVSGKVKNPFKKVTLEPAEYEILNAKNNNKIHTGKIIPIYPQRWGLSSRTLRDKLNFVLSNHLDNLEFLPDKIIVENNLVDESSAYKNIHFPKNLSDTSRARERLSFDELFTIQLSALLVRKNWQKEVVGQTFEVNKYNQKINQFIKKLPFKLTLAQLKVTSEIL